MQQAAVSAPGRSARHMVLLGGLAVGTLDGLFASAFWAAAAGMSPVRVFQSVAAGVLGLPASIAGGVPTALLGLGLHYAIATMFVIAYTLVAGRVQFLTRHLLACGIAYGLLLYVIMNFVVVPLSAIGQLPKFDNIPWIASSVVMHAIFGVMCAFFAGKAVAAKA